MGSNRFLSQKDPAAAPPEKCEFPTLFRSFPRSSPELPGAPRSSPELPGAPRSSPELPGAPPGAPPKFRVFFLRKKPVSDIFHRKLLKMRPLYQNNRFRTFSIETCAKGRFSAAQHYNRFQTCSPEFARQKKQQQRQFTHTSHEKPAASATQPLQTSLGLISTLRFLGALCLKVLLQIVFVSSDFLQFFLSSGSTVAVVPISHRSEN